MLMLILNITEITNFFWKKMLELKQILKNNQLKLEKIREYL